MGELSREQVRLRLLEHVHAVVDYWSTLATPLSARERVSGCAFSLLAALDGCAADLPGFVVAPAPHRDDRAYQEAQGEDYYPEAPDVACDIAGGLHELYANPQRAVWPREGDDAHHGM